MSKTYLGADDDTERHSLSSHDSCESYYGNQLHNPRTLQSVQPSVVYPEDEEIVEEEGVSRKTSLHDKSIMVPRKDRRGILATLAILPEYKDARDYPQKIKSLVILLIAMAAMMGPMGTSIIFPAINEIAKDYNTKTIMVNVSVGIYLLSLGVFPLWWSSLSEMRGRRTVYVISFSLLFAFSIGSALAPNINAFIVFRMLCGASSASVQSVGAGTVADLFKPEERGKNLGYYYLGSLMAPLFAPIIGSLLVNRWSWRSTQWFMVILAGVTVLLLSLLLPETLRTQEDKNAIAAILAERKQMRAKESTSPESDKSQDDGQNESEDEQEQELTRAITLASEVSQYPGENDDVYVDAMAPQASRIQSRDPDFDRRMRQGELRRWRSNVENELEKLQTAKTAGSAAYGRQTPLGERFKRACYLYLFRPLKSLVFLRYPPVSLAITFSAISFGILYFVNITIEYKYSRPPYNFKPLYVGLLYIPNSVTYIIASIYGGRWVDNLLKQYQEKHGTSAPEARISWNVVTAVISFPAALLIFGWCLEKDNHWETPLVGTALFGFASMMTIGATVAYLVDSLPGKGATGVALNNLIRQIFAATAVFTTEPMLEGMGTGWAFTMLAFIVIAASSVLVVLKWRGDHWRESFDLQRLYDLLE
ncbi:LAMI_0H07844g1_1 [Lachancea mirantina]|uniref:LAMI_0H07844g1_1 n=1 Tax=Lachancea mirantina TaxID=1230905 RepID=A0A1G4KFW8_9SACH|nr:LAMI_0H07844g1_1 [Lachancea mirantina]